MSKELKVLEETLKDLECDLAEDDNPYLRDRYCKLLDLKQTLQKLEAIKNAKPSEALKCLNYFEKNSCLAMVCVANNLKERDYRLALDTIRQVLLKTQEQEKENAKYKKAFNIIKKKGFDKSIKDYKDYDIWLEEKIEQFSKSIEKHPAILNWEIFEDFTYNREEFYFLKEMLKDE